MVRIVTPHARGARCRCLAAVLRRNVSLEGWVKHTVILSYNDVARFPRAFHRSSPWQPFVNESSGFFNDSIEPVHTTDWPVCAQIERFPSQSPCSHFPMTLLAVT